METGELTGGTPETARYTFRFRGTAGEYFRIWIVNLFLTVITLGVYAAWAKVRTRRYIWANIDLAGHPFTFHGKPAAILRGNVIIAALFTAYIAMERFEPAFAGVLFVVFTFVFPFLVCKSLRFNAHNTSYRNIRFNFQGRLRRATRPTFSLPASSPSPSSSSSRPGSSTRRGSSSTTWHTARRKAPSMDAKDPSTRPTSWPRSWASRSSSRSPPSLPSAPTGLPRVPRKWGPLKIIIPCFSRTSSEPRSFIPSRRSFTP